MSLAGLELLSGLARLSIAEQGLSIYIEQHIVFINKVFPLQDVQYQHKWSFSIVFSSNFILYYKMFMSWS